MVFRACDFTCNITTSISSSRSTPFTHLSRRPKTITLAMPSSVPCTFVDHVAIDNVKKLYRDGMIKPQSLKEGHCLSIRVVGLQKVVRDKGIPVPSTRAFKEALRSREGVFVKHVKFSHEGSQSFALCFKRSSSPPTQTHARVRLGAEQVEVLENMISEEALIHIQSLVIPAGYHVEMGPLQEEPIRRKKKAEYSEGQATVDCEEDKAQRLKRLRETFAPVQQSQAPEPSMLFAASDSMVGSDAGGDVGGGHHAVGKEDRFYVRFEDNPADSHIDDNLFVFKGQKEPVVLDKDQMSAFLRDEVDVYHMKAVRRTAGYGLRLEFYRDDTPRTRLEFLEEYTLWFARQVL